MLDLDFQVEGAEPERGTAVPSLRFQLRASERAAAGAEPTQIHSVALRCQIQIEPARRHYSAEEQRRLVDLFGTPERWGQTVRPMLWTLASIVVKPFAGSTNVTLPVPCSHDFSLAATRYFDALQGGEIPLCFLFNGTVFYEGEDGRLQMSQIPWEKEANYRLPAATWKALAEMYYGHSAWLRVPKEIVDRLRAYQSRRALPSLEGALETLLRERE